MKISYLALEDRLLFHLIFKKNDYYDFMVDNRFVEDDFYNFSHLTEEGARKFSLMLKEKLFPQ